MLVMLDFHWDSSLFTKARGLWFCVPAVLSIFSTTKHQWDDGAVHFYTRNFCWGWFWTDFEINESPTVEFRWFLMYVLWKPTFSHARSSAWCTRDDLWMSTGLKNTRHHRHSDKLKPINQDAGPHTFSVVMTEIYRKLEIKSLQSSPNMESDCSN